MEELKELYAKYGELKVQEEIIANAINDVKRAIAEKINSAQNAPATDKAPVEINQTKIEE